MPSPITVTSGDGVARLQWTGEVNTDELRREIAEALVHHSRVEALVGADDTRGPRAATWGGRDPGPHPPPLSADGLTLTGEPQKLIKQTLEWEGDLVEAPTVVARDGGYALLYSSNSYGDDRYNVGVATAATLEGPWQKNDEPILSTQSSEFRYMGPGGQDVVTGPDGSDYLVFHGWDSAFTYRGMHTAPLTWEGLIPRIVLND